ncbi:chromatin-remodeling ATPase INO80-like [Macrobrachium rosenbergii]|uniref:chromatin-remodeling ATPase INO80-like n=1 Tax=Macrobrachium rosenbergii TaxID=79674 RepID=UPI0034D706DA
MGSTVRTLLEKNVQSDTALRSDSVVNIEEVAVCPTSAPRQRSLSCFPTPGRRHTGGPREAERENDKSHLFNFEGLRKKRYWLKEVLIDSDSDDDNDDSEFTQEYLENMLREHRLRKHDQSHFYQNEDVCIF